jgi:hypothetical protein
LFAPPAPVEATRTLRHYALEAELTGFSEHDRALGDQRLAELDSDNAGDEPQKRLATRLNRPQAQIVAVAARKVERQQRGPRSAALSQQRSEIAASVVAEHHRLAVIKAWSTGRPQTASAIAGNRSVKSAPRRLHTFAFFLV